MQNLKCVDSIILQKVASIILPQQNGNIWRSLFSYFLINIMYYQIFWLVLLGNFNLHFSIVKDFEYIFIYLTYSYPLCHLFIYFYHCLLFVFLLLIYSAFLYIKEIRLWLWYQLHAFFLKLGVSLTVVFIRTFSSLWNKNALFYVIEV